MARRGSYADMNAELSSTRRQRRGSLLASQAKASGPAATSAAAAASASNRAGSKESTASAQAAAAAGSARAGSKESTASRGSGAGAGGVRARPNPSAAPTAATYELTPSEARTPAPSQPASHVSVSESAMARQSAEPGRASANPAGQKSSGPTLVSVSGATTATGVTNAGRTTAASNAQQRSPSGSKDRAPAVQQPRGAIQLNVPVPQQPRSDGKSLTSPRPSADKTKSTSSAEVIFAGQSGASTEVRELSRLDSDTGNASASAAATASRPSPSVSLQVKTDAAAVPAVQVQAPPTRRASADSPLGSASGSPKNSASPSE